MASAPARAGPIPPSLESASPSLPAPSAVVPRTGASQPPGGLVTAAAPAAAAAAAAAAADSGAGRAGAPAALALSPSSGAVSDDALSPPARRERHVAELFTHPTSELLLRLLVDICAAALRMQKGHTTVEAVLDLYPPGADANHVVAYQSRVLMGVMAELRRTLTRALVVDDTRVANNLCRFCNLLVDKVYAGMLPFGDRQAYEFVLELLKLLDADGAGRGRDSTAQVLYRQLNRMVIWLVSNPSAAAAADLAFVLSSLAQNERLVFGPGNTDPEFVPVLCYHLYRLLLDDAADLREGAMTVWRLLLTQRATAVADVLVARLSSSRQDPPVDLLHGGFDLLLTQGFTAFSFWMGDHDTQIQAVFDETAKKVWLAQQAVESRQRLEQRRAAETRVAQRAARREKKLRVDARQLEVGDQSRIHEFDSRRAAVRTRLQRRRERLADHVAHTATRWAAVLDDLVSELGVWGEPDPYVEWMLDPTEGPFRMRKKLMRRSREDRARTADIPRRLGPGGAAAAGAASDTDPDAPAPAALMTVDTPGSVPTPVAPLALNFMETPQPADEDAAQAQADAEAAAAAAAAAATAAEAAAKRGEAAEKGGHGGEEQEDDFNVLRLLDSGEQIQYRYNCARVSMMDKCDGVLLLCVRAAYLIDNYRVTPAGDIVPLSEAGSASADDSTASGASAAAAAAAATPGPATSGTVGAAGTGGGRRPGAGAGGDLGSLAPAEVLGHKVMKWEYEHITAIHKRRHLLRPTALEIFGDDGRSTLLVLDIGERDRCYARLSGLISSNLSLLAAQLAGTDSELGGVEGGLLPWRQTLTQKWQRGEVSNFQYLMHLNMLAGRSYNDLTQYPVFPWVLADYTSDTLDVTDERVYRDLSRPMGALSERRLQEFIGRYEMWDDPHVPKFHYGTHYSSAAIVMYYLVRLPPYTEHAVHFQGGRFDHADRMFHSVADTWLGASAQNVADVKELVPEFFYLPEFLRNLNHYELGRRQGGTLLDDVVLPPWARGDAHEFVRTLRRALESDYVSSHLHEWIDLVFGYKQRGPAAVAAHNVFYYLTYEGAVDIDAIDDPVVREATVAQIQNFGQTPRCLFTRPHPRRQLVPPAPTVYSHCELLVAQPIKNVDIGEAVGQIRLVNERLFVVGERKVVQPPRFHKYLSWGHDDHSLRTFTVVGDRLAAVAEDMHDGALTAVALTDDGRLLITGGADSLVNVWSYFKTRNDRVFALHRTLCGHVRPVTCVAVSQPYQIIVSGAEDGTVIVWDMSRLMYVRQLPPHPAAISAIAVNDVTGDIVTCCGNNIYVWSVNGDPLAQNFKLPGSTVTAVTVSLGPEHELNNVIITVHRDGSVRLWSINFLQRPVQLPPGAMGPHVRELFVRHTLPVQNVTAVHLSSDQKRLYTGDASGRVSVWTVPERT